MTLFHFKQPWPLYVFLPLMWLLHITSLHMQSPTYDEHTHLEYGVNLWHGNAERSALGYFGNSKMPVSALNALPVYMAQFFPEASPAYKTLGSLNAARIPSVLVSLLLGILIFHWAKQWYGFKAGALALFLYAFSPNILAHSQLVTTDIFAAAGVAWALYRYYLFLNRPSLKNALWAGAAFGMAQISKYTAVFLVPQFIILWMFWRWAQISGTNASPPKISLKHALAAIGMAWFIINTAFLWRTPLLPIKDYPFRSQTFQNIQQALGPLANLPVFVASPYLEGLEWVYSDDRAKVTTGNIYLIGETRSDRGFKGYFLIASLFKTPLAAIVLLFVAFGVGWLRIRTKQQAAKESFLLVPMAFFTIYFNFFYNSQVGVRHILVMTPLVAIWTSSLLAQKKNIARPWAISLIALLIYNAVSTLSYHRHYLSYFNELVWDRKMAYKILADSNLDWGQSQYYLNAYLQNNPNAVYAPAGPTPGTIIVGANSLVGVFPRTFTRYQWLRDNYEPVDHIGYSFLIYQIADDEKFQRIKTGSPAAFTSSPN